MDGSWGGGHSIKNLPRYTDDLVALEVKTILDYGCANGKFKPYMNNEHPEYTITEYDPGIEGKDALPDPADYVVCCDVMEHIEEDFLDSVMQHLQGLIRKGAFFNISTVEAHAILDDGSNAHKLVKPAAWWVEMFEKFFEVNDVYDRRTNVCFKVRPKQV